MAVDTSVTRNAQPAHPFPENGRADGHGRACRRCEAISPVDADRCVRCQSWLPGNAAAVRTGVYRQQQPLDLRQTSDEMIAGIVSDLGGVDELSTLERATVRHIGDVTVMLQLLMNSMVTDGMLTPARSVRQVYGQYLAGLDRFDRLAVRVGLKRRPRRVASLADVLDQATREIDAE